MQDLSLEDILPRKASSSKNINFSKDNILITGAGGSIGSEICRQIVRLKPNKLLHKISILCKDINNHCYNC